MFLTLQWKQSKRACRGLLTMFWFFTVCSHVSVQVPPLPPLPRLVPHGFVWFFFCYFSSSCVALLLAHLVILFLPCPAVHFLSWYSLLTVKCVHSCVDFYWMHLSILAHLSQAFADVRAAASMLSLHGIKSGWGGSSNLKIGDRNLKKKKNPTMHRRCGTLLVLQQSVV